MYLVTTHLSEILEHSQRQPVIIFKYSNSCGTSTRLDEELKNLSIDHPIYKVTVQTESVLSKKIEDWFEIKHESPQIIILNHKKVTYSAHHGEIDPDKFIYG